MKLTVTNLLSYPYGVNARVDGADRVVTLAPNETWEGEFSDNEAKALTMNASFAVKGYAAPADQPKTDVAGDVAQVTKERDEARSALVDIANLFGTPDVDELNVKAAVQRLIEDSRDVVVDVGAGNELTPSTGGRKPNETDADVGVDLAAAVALLDDTNDDHWTQAGKPDIAALKSLTGGDVTRAQVDALPTQRERVK